MLEIAIALIVGFALGYGVREWISYRRHQAAAERRRDRGNGRRKRGRSAFRGTPARRAASPQGRLTRARDCAVPNQRSGHAPEHAQKATRRASASKMHSGRQLRSPRGAT